MQLLNFSIGFNFEMRKENFTKYATDVFSEKTGGQLIVSSKPQD